MNYSRAADPRQLIHRRKAWYIPVVGGVALAYFLAALLGLQLQIPGTNASPVWPPTGIALTALLLGGMRMLPGVAIGAFFANFLMFPPGLALGSKLIAGVLIATGNTLEAVVAAILVAKVGQRLVLERARDVFGYTLGILLSSAISATIGSASVCGIIIGSWVPLWNIWLTWWLGDVAGGLVVCAALVSWIQALRGYYPGGTSLEAIALLIVTGVTTHLVFGGLTGTMLDRLPYLLYVAPLWAAFRLNLRHTVTVVFVISAIAVWHTTRGSGPFFMPESGSVLAALSREELQDIVQHGGASGDIANSLAWLINDALLMLQFFVCTLAVIAGYIAAAVKERDGANLQMQSLNRSLEERVNRRTAALEHANDTLSKRAADLARSNQLLDQFAHAAAHDLRSPLRAMSMLAQWVGDDEASTLSVESRESLALLQRRVVRLDALLDGLLRYATVGRHNNLLEEVDSGRAIREVVDLISNAYDHEIRLVGPMPQLYTYRAAFVQVMRNLVGNAVEHHGGKGGLVEIQANWRSDPANDSMIEFSVSDNGKGIDRKYHEQVFRIFQTIETRDRHESSGVGLSLVRSIVESMGGQVRLESEPGKGTRVSFTWPQRTRASEEVAA